MNVNEWLFEIRAIIIAWVICSFFGGCGVGYGCGTKDKKCPPPSPIECVCESVICEPAMATVHCGPAGPMATFSSDHMTTIIPPMPDPAPADDPHHGASAECPD